MVTLSRHGLLMQQNEDAGCTPHCACTECKERRKNRGPQPPPAAHDAQQVRAVRPQACVTITVALLFDRDDMPTDSSLIWAINSGLVCHGYEAKNILIIGHEQEPA